MNRLRVVTKYFMKNALGEMFGNNKMKTIFLSLIMIFSIIVISIPFALIIASGYESFHAAGQEGMLLALMVSAGAGICFLLGTYTIMNVFYFSDDIEVLLPMPIKSSELIIGKFLAVLLNMYMYTSILILPLIAYGIVSKASIIYYLYLVLVLIITPVFPMVLASIICMILMRFTKLSKHKDGFRMFIGCISLIFVILFNYLNSALNGNMTHGQTLLKFSEGHNSMMDTMTGIFIINKFSSYALLYNNKTSGLLYIILTLVTSMAIFAAYSYIGGKLYLKGIIGISESYSTRENILENGKADKIIKINSPLKALVVKDIKIMFRTPTYFINCVAMIFYMPAILGVSMISNGGLANIKNMLNSTNRLNGFVIVGAFVLAAMSIMTGGAASIALSREGRDIIVSKYIPISYKTHLHSKIISSLCINGMAVVITAIVLILIGINKLLFILGLLVSIGAILLISLIGLFLDFSFPKLTWETEKAIFQKNYLPVLIMVIVVVISGILVILNFFINNYIVIFLVCMSIVLFGSLILYRLLLKLAYKIFG